MYNVPVARKVCATCKWWRGKRELTFVGARTPQFVVVDNIVPAGHKCAAWKVDRGSTHQCNRWTQHRDGYSERSLWKCKKFYLVFKYIKILHTRVQNLTRLHYRLLMRLEDATVREWYINEALKAA